MNKLANEKHKHRLIVLPIQPPSSVGFNGIGLTLHFLLGNTVAVNAYLKEFWFGWRVNKLFSDENKLKAFARGETQSLYLESLSAEQGIRFWLYGQAEDDHLSLFLFDGDDKGPAASKRIYFTFEDDLVGVRKSVVKWLDKCGLPYPQPRIRAALWPEKMTPESADKFGRALELFYIHSAYGASNTEKIDLSPYEAVVALSPQSFMGQNLLGWALYRNEDYPRAKAAFIRAMQINPDAPGVVSGLMWCSVHTNNEEEAIYWAERKAALLDKDIEMARQNTLERLKKVK